jgi:hypothetical protein
VAQRRREVAQGAPLPPVEGDARVVAVAAEELIPTVAAEGHGSLLTDETRQEIGRNHRRIGNRLVVLPGERFEAVAVNRDGSGFEPLLSAARNRRGQRMS